MPRMVLTAIVAAAIAASSAPVLAQPGEPRVWKDATGKFEVRATLVEQTAKNVRLLTDKGREVTVPIERLSKADRDHLASLAAPADDPFAGGAPATAGRAKTAAGGAPVSAKTVLPATGTTVSLRAPKDAVAFEPDPPPAPPAVPANVVSFGTIESAFHVLDVVPTDPAGGRCLVCMSKDSFNAQAGTIRVVDLRQESCNVVADEQRTVRVWDHDPGTGLTLVSEGVDGRGHGGEVAVFSGVDAGAPKKLYRRTLPGDQTSSLSPKFEWLRFASPTLVAAIVEKGLWVWDLPATRLVYRADDVDAEQPPVFSGTRRHMAIPQRGKVVVVETATGRVLRSIFTGGSARPGAAFDAAGRRLAICSGNAFLVWDCVANEAVGEGTTTEELGTHPIYWVDPDMFLTESGALVHVELGMTVWRYSFGPRDRTARLGDKLLVFDGADGQVATVEVPHGPVEAVIDGLRRLGDEDKIMRPGDPIAVSVEATDKADEQLIAEWVGRSVKRAGWKVSADAPVTLVAKVGRSEPKKIKVRDIDRGNAVVDATLSPFYALLEIRRGSLVLWSRSERNHIPFFLEMNPGDTVQTAIDRYEKPNAEFFAGLRFPPTIAGPESRKMVGSSSLVDGRWK